MIEYHDKLPMLIRCVAKSWIQISSAMHSRNSNSVNVFKGIKKTTNGFVQGEARHRTLPDLCPVGSVTESGNRWNTTWVRIISNLKPRVIKAQARPRRCFLFGIWETLIPNLLDVGPDQMEGNLLSTQLGAVVISFRAMDFIFPQNFTRSLHLSSLFDMMYH